MNNFSVSLDKEGVKDLITFDSFSNLIEFSEVNFMGVCVSNKFLSECFVYISLVECFKFVKERCYNDANVSDNVLLDFVCRVIHHEFLHKSIRVCIDYDDSEENDKEESIVRDLSRTNLWDISF